MRPFTLLIKPTGADCNLDCDYCFYLEKAGLYPETKQHRMSDDVLHELIRKYLETNQTVHTFAWQGGEPTIMGQGFFEKAISYEIQYAKKGHVISNGLQTNCTLLTDEFADFLFNKRFLVGASLDGPSHFHNPFRVFKNEAESFDSVWKGIHHLQKHHVDFNILTVVNKKNVQKPAEVYDYLYNKRFRYLQFIPCVEFDLEGNPLPFTITGKEWGEFLCEIFDLWYDNHMTSVSIREFDDMLSLIVDNTVTSCYKGTDCRRYLVVEHNGDVYPCDFFVEEDLKLGNIMENSWEELLESPIYYEFGKSKSNLHEDCLSCEYLSLCNGDCQKHRRYAGNPANNLSWLCEGYKIFYGYALDRLKNIAETIKRKRVVDSLLQQGE